MFARAALAACLSLFSARAQSVAVYSEFRRVDPFGRIVASDRAGRPREILSPAVARNAYASFHLVVRTPPGKPFTLHFAENPEGFVEATLYKQVHALHDGHWIPDRLQPVAWPYQSTIPEAGDPVPNRTVIVLWLDLWVKPDVPARRVRVEAQLNVGAEWLIYPLELRIQQARLPTPPQLATPLAPPARAADLTAVLALRAGLCGTATSARSVQPPGVRERIRRNALQDLALLSLLDKSQAPIRSNALSILGVPDEKAWCASNEPPDPEPESYLKVRDLLLRGGED